jgi:hypothetical protein
VDGQVQQDFAGSLPLTGDLDAFHVDCADVVRSHEAFTDHRGRTEDFVLADADRDVAVVGGGESLVVDATSDLADFFFELSVVDPTIPLTGHADNP